MLNHLGLVSMTYFWTAGKSILPPENLSDRKGSRDELSQLILSVTGNICVRYSVANVELI